MQIKDFYVIAETSEELTFIDTNIELMLDLSLRQRDILTTDEYQQIITNRLEAWRKDGNF